MLNKDIGGMMKNILNFLKWLVALAVLSVICLGVWWLGQHLAWDWSGFWSNFISNAGSSAVIGAFLYWLITRPDEKKAANQRRDQALSMLKIEFQVNLERVKQYGDVLKSPEQDLAPYYPLRLTRGAWNALKESGFLPQFEDVGFVYELLRLNEVIVVANKTLSQVRSAKVGKNTKTKLSRYSKKAVKDCAQIEGYLIPILAKLETRRLSEVALPEDGDDHSETKEDDVGTDLDEVK